MNTFKKIILATFVISTLGLSGLAASASIKNSQTHPTISQGDKNNQIAEASDGDGEMNDALEAELEQKTQTENSSTRVSEVNKTQEVSQDKDGGDETREISDEPNDNDEGDETQETR
ncbi:MAG: hypothetical protein RLZZ574_744 [Cyanobacteriota bacterium]|jgi:hypothetical protein